MTNNLDLSQVASNQTQKEVTINDQAGEIDAALTETLVSDYTSADITLTNTEFRRNVNFKSSNLTVARTLNIPASIPRWFFVDNTDGTNTLTVDKGTTTIDLAAGEVAGFVADDTANGLFLMSSNGQAPFDVGFGLVGTPSAAEIVGMFIFTRSASFPDDFAGSQAEALTAATGSTTFDVLKNGSNIGSITWAAAATAATFSTTGGTAETFAAGDELRVVAEDPADATLANIHITFQGTRVA
jgi:hypothetical protein